MKPTLFFFFCLLINYSVGQANASAKFISEFSFTQLNGGVVLVQATLDTISQKFNFILDTGSGGISLDSTTAAEFNISHVPSGRTITGIAGTRKVDYARYRKLNFPGLTVDSLDFYINNYEILTGVYGIKIDGIIGYSFLSRYVVRLDYDSLKMAVYTPGKIKYPSGGTLLSPLFTALPIQELTLKDKRKVKGKFFIDTGAGLCMLVGQRFEEDSSLVKDKRKPVTIQVQGLGGKKEMGLTIIQKVSIGPYTFRKVPTNILDDEFNALSYPFVGGVIGNDILHRFNTILNYPNKEIHIIPNSHYHDDFDYSYTGINMYVEEGVIFADDVMENSPADKAGLKKDDVIMGVNGNFSNDVSVYKKMMGTPGQKVQVVVMRNEAPLIIYIKVGRIY